VASDHYPWLPVAALFGHEMDAAAALSASTVPTAIIAAQDDQLIVRARTDGLLKAVRSLSYNRTIGRAGHNDIYHKSEFQDAMREAFRILTR
jgi:hypothetical protein